MKMPKFSLLAALAAGALLAFTPNLRAQDAPAKSNRPERPEGGPRGGQRGDMLKEMAEKLNLTAEQKTKLQEAMKAQRETMKDATPEARREKAKENRKAMDAKIKEILTAEQYTKWEKIREENRPGGPGAPDRKPPGEKPVKK
jgi:Spy/CpxP family protein refolding chaperone